MKTQLLRALLATSILFGLLALFTLDEAGASGESCTISGFAGLTPGDASAYNGSGTVSCSGITADNAPEISAYFLGPDSNEYVLGIYSNDAATGPGPTYAGLSDFIEPLAFSGGYSNDGSGGPNGIYSVSVNADTSETPGTLTEAAPDLSPGPVISGAVTTAFGDPVSTGFTDLQSTPTTYVETAAAVVLSLLSVALGIVLVWKWFHRAARAS